MDFSNIRFRASQLGLIMSNPKSKQDKEAGILSETAKAHLVEVYIREKYGRDKEIYSKYLEKGTRVEQDSIDILSSVLGVKLVKNETRYENDWITGTPDIITQDGIIDIKSSFDIFTFFSNAVFNPDKVKSSYFTQMQAYMWLTGKEKAMISTVLTNTPPDIIQSETKYHEIDSAIQRAEALTFDDIPFNERVFNIVIYRDENFTEKAISKIKFAREHLQKMEMEAPK